MENGSVDSSSTAGLFDNFSTDDYLRALYYEHFKLNATINWKIPQYYSVPYQIIGTIFQGIIFIVGVLGNIMVVIVVLRSRGMRTPTNCYLVSLAIADSMVLVASVPNEIIAYYILGDKWIWGSAGCAIFIFLQYLGINASSLSIAAFTFERYIAICHPMRAHKLCTVRRAKRIILYVWMFATVYCAPWIFLTKIAQIHYIGVESKVYTCKFALNREYYKGYYLTDIVLFYICPLLMSCVLYALIARILYNKDILRREKSSNTTMMASSTTSAGSVTTSCTTATTNNILIHNHNNTSNHYHNPQHQNHSSVGINNAQSTSKLNLTSTTTTSSQPKRNMSSNDSSRVQVVKMLAVVVAVFATLWLPYRALVVYNSFTFPPYMELWYLMFAKTMIFVNSAINPIIYSACSIKFRREFKRMLTCTGTNNYYYWSHRTGGNGTIFSGTTNADITISDAQRGRPGIGQRSRLNSLQSMDSTLNPVPVHQMTVGGVTVRRDDNYLSPMHALIGYQSSIRTSNNTPLPQVSSIQFSTTSNNNTTDTTIASGTNNKNGSIALRTSTSFNGIETKFNGGGTNAVLATIVSRQDSNNELRNSGLNLENSAFLAKNNDDPLHVVIERNISGSNQNSFGSCGNFVNERGHDSGSQTLITSNSTISLSPSTTTIIKTTTSITFISSEPSSGNSNQQQQQKQSSSQQPHHSSKKGHRKKKCHSEGTIKPESLSSPAIISSMDQSSSFSCSKSGHCSREGSFSSATSHHCSKSNKKPYQQQ